MQKSNLKVVRQRSTLKQQVLDGLRAAIFEMHFLPGERLVERELCEMLGVSRTLIRESISQLEAEGLIQNIPHKGPIVSVYSADEVKGIYETRAVLEALAGKTFAERATDAEIKELQEALIEIEKAYKSETALDWLTAKSSFYSVLLEGARNLALTEMLRLIHGQVSMLRATTMSQAGRKEISVLELAKIVEAIVARDGERAAEACRQHVFNAGTVAVKAISEQSLLKTEAS